MFSQNSTAGISHCSIRLKLIVCQKIAHARPSSKTAISIRAHSLTKTKIQNKIKLFEIKKRRESFSKHLFLKRFNTSSFQSLKCQSIQKRAIIVTSTKSGEVIHLKFTLQIFVEVACPNWQKRLLIF